MATFIDDAAAIDDDHTLDVLEVAQIVTDHDHGPPFHQLPNRLHHQGRRPAVQAGRGFIEDHDGSVFDDGPRDRDTLPLPSAQCAAALADRRVVSVRHRADHVIDAGALRGADDLCPARARVAVADVFRDAGREEDRLLEDQADLVTQRGQLELADVTAIDEHAPRDRIVETRDESDQRALAGSRRPDDPDALARFDPQIDVAEHLPAPVRQADAVKDDLACEARRVDRLRQISHRRLEIQHLHHSLGRRRPARRPLGHARNPSQRPIEGLQIPHEDDDVTGRERAGQDTARRHPNHDGRDHRHGDLGVPAKLRLQPRRLQAGPQAPLVLDVEAIDLVLLAAKALNHLDRSQHLRRDRRDVSLPVPLAPHRSLHRALVRPQHQGQPRQHQQREQRQAPVHEKHHHDHPDDQHQLADDRQGQGDEDVA